MRTRAPSGGGLFGGVRRLEQRNAIAVVDTAVSQT
ncbi:MAG: hypothetical protein GAK40_01154 [Burkholderia plantarii]|nr:MAG: hypothetical protein GAK40_01154 [Burkholderia plantarii]